MNSIRHRSGYMPFSRIFNEEYHPYEISETILEDIHLASQYQSKSLWAKPDEALVRGYNNISRNRLKKKYHFPIGVVTDKEYKRFELCITHSKLPKEFLDKGVTDMEYHLSLVLFPWDRDPESENYYPSLCSPKNSLAFNITDVEREQKRFSASVSYIDYDGISPPYVYDSGMIANMLHRDFGSSIIKRYEPDEEFYKLDKPKIIKFGETQEYYIRTLKHKFGDGSSSWRNHQPF